MTEIFTNYPHLYNLTDVQMSNRIGHSLRGGTLIGRYPPKNNVICADRGNFCLSCRLRKVCPRPNGEVESTEISIPVKLIRVKIVTKSQE